MDDRSPIIDASTYEVLYEIYKSLIGDNTLTDHDIAYMAGQLKTVLILNSIPPTDPRADPGMLEQIKSLGRKILP